MTMISRPLNIKMIDSPRSLADVPVMNLFGVAVLFLAAFFNLTSLDPEKTTVSLDINVVVKLMILALGGLYGMLGFLGDYRVRKLVLSFPGAWILLIFFWYCLSIPGAIDPEAAITSSCSIVSVFLMTLTALVRLGRQQVVQTIFLAAAAFVAGSWLAYFFVPELGVYFEAITDGRLFKRMAGLSHPNTLGQFSAITIVLGIILFINYRQRGYFRVLIVAMAVGALAMSLSRASIIACIVSLAYVYRHVVFRPQNRIWFLWLTAAAIVMLMVVSTQVDVGRAIRSRLASLSKSGDTQELVTATGRLEIWNQSIKLIGARPLTGYGAASSKDLLDEYSRYTHNMLLNVALSTGILGGLTMLLMMLSRIKLLWIRSNPIADGLAVLILVNGLVENVIFSTLCGLPTIAWLVGLVWFQLGPQDEPVDEQDIPGGSVSIATLP
jgi:O-antigen ligase